MNKNKRDDRRVKYTKQALREALIDLLRNRPIEKISVKEICELADINRSTFYSHYTDVHDLLDQIEKEMLDDIDIYISGIYKGEDGGESREFLVRIIDYAIENATLCKVLLGEHCDTKFFETIIMSIQRRALDEWADTISADADTLDYSMVFCVSGSISVIRQWLRNDMDKSAAELSDILMSLSFSGLSRYISNGNKNK